MLLQTSSKWDQGIIINFVRCGNKHYDYRRKSPHVLLMLNEVYRKHAECLGFALK